MAHELNESPADEYVRTFFERRKSAEAAVARWAGHFWLAHVVLPMCLFLAMWLTYVWVEMMDELLGSFGHDSGMWLAEVAAVLLVFGGMAYSLVAAGLSGVGTLRAWSVLRWRVRAYGLSPWAVVSAEALLIFFAAVGF